MDKAAVSAAAFFTPAMKWMVGGEGFEPPTPSV
jgi:hypothetical protein